ncbi:MAG: carbohydrate ABC transporter permease [Rhodospirillaceae bacterium]|nr:carbohydrate ABC transporter permease [Rhodospirillaceae bacterium]
MRAPDEPGPAGRAVSYLLLGGWALVVLFPLYWLAITSLKQPIDVNDGPFYLPFIDFRPTLDAWRYLFVEMRNDTLRPYFNTVVVALASSVIAVVVGSMAAYALVRITYRPRLGNLLLFVLCVGLAVLLVVRLGVPWQAGVAAALAVFALLLATLGRRFRRHLGNNDIAFWMVSQRILPPVAVVVPIYVLFQHLGLLDTRAALIVVYVAVNVPIVVWLMRDFFHSIPLELEEVAMIDGATRYRIFWSVVLPLSRPGFAATFILVLIMAWNEYLLALFLSSANAQTMPLLVAAQNATRGPQWWYMSVLIVVMILPVTALAVVLERFITQGLLIGAVKG